MKAQGGVVTWLGGECVYEVRVRHGPIWRPLVEREHLPRHHAVAPDVWRHAVLAISQHFRAAPAQWRRQTTPSITRLHTRHTHTALQWRRQTTPSITRLHTQPCSGVAKPRPPSPAYTHGTHTALQWRRQTMPSITRLHGTHTDIVHTPVSYTHLTLPTIYSV